MRVAPGLVDTSSPASDAAAALARHAMANTTLTGATADVDGRQLLAEAV